jgi:hypothetical protein
MWKKVVQLARLTGLGLLIGLSSYPGFASVDLSSFTISPGDGEVLLDWETGSELNFVGFIVLRNDQDDGNYSQWEDIEVIDRDDNQAYSFIPSRDDFGALYRFRDPDVTNGTQTCYALEALNSDGPDTFYPADPTCVVPGGAPTNTPTATWTPSATSSPTGTGPAVSPTATVTSLTPSPTSAITPTPSRTLRPTNTPKPTRTPTSLLSATPTLTATATLTRTGTVTPTLTPTASFTFVPTLTATPTPTRTSTRTPTRTATLGPLLDSTLAPDSAAVEIPGLSDQAEMSLIELIVTVAVAIALVGGLIFALLYLLILRVGRR